MQRLPYWAMFHLLLCIASLLAPTDKLLNDRANGICPCHIQSASIQAEIDQLLQAAVDAKSLILAATQIGILHRILVLEGKVYIDPEILSHCKPVAFVPEMCLSTDNIFGIVPRATKILIRAYDRSAHLFT